MIFYYLKTHYNYKHFCYFSLCFLFSFFSNILGGLLLGLSGLYATIKHHRRLLYTHTIINWSLFILRFFTWLLSILHEYNFNQLLLYGLAPIELLLALLSTILLRDALIYY